MLKALVFFVIMLICVDFQSIIDLYVLWVRMRFYGTSHWRQCNMKTKNFILKHMMTIIVVLVIVFIGALITWTGIISDDAVIESTVDEMEQIGIQYQTLMTNTLEEAQENLMIFAELIVANNVDEENIVEYLDSQSQSYVFDSLYYIDLDGNGVSKDNYHRDFSENQSFINALESKFDIEDPYISAETSEVVFDLAVPVIKNGETKAVMFCEVSMDDFFELILSNKDYEGDIFFVDNDLNMMFSTSGNHVGEIVIPEEDILEMGIENVVKTQKDIENQQSGSFYYDYFGIPKIMVYYPIEQTNVALAMNAHVESLSSEIVFATDSFEIIGIIIYWTIIALVIYVAITQSRASKRIKKVAYYDPLTQLANMAKLKLDMTTVLEKNKKEKYSIIVLDIENFKAINEMFGYDIGDRVLKAVKSLSDSFNEPSLVTARIGSDKFVMFAGYHFFEDLSFFAQAVDEHYDVVVPELADYGGTFKIGRYHIEKGETNFDDIMAKVSLAHSKAKATKGEMLRDYDDTLKNQVKVDADITNKMRAALANEEFKVFLQPKFRTSDDKLAGAEALVRWIETDGGMIFPNDFIPLFERNGFIVELDQYILEHVCIMLRRWMDEEIGEITISVNCSRLNLENPYFVDNIIEIVDKYNVPHECIEIELTESTTIANESTIEQIFIDLRKNGFKISIDDFGAGYSSLGILKNLHVDTLKMDRSFFVGGKNARRDDLLIDSIVKMSHNLGMYVVAEGIETAEQVELLKSMNCDAVQGYFYDKPIPVAEFEEKYRTMIAENSLGTVLGLPVIQQINDIKYASSFVPGGMIVAKLDEYFTLVEANDYYFDMIGYTREEVRDIFKNRGVNLMDPEGKAEILEYVGNAIQNDPDAYIESTNKFTLQSGEERIYKMNGKIAVNESGQTRLYASITDITDYSRVDNDLQNERDFVAQISALTNSAFYAYDIDTKTMRFSKNFAHRFDIPDIIENFTDSKLGKEMFPQSVEMLKNITTSPHKSEGEFCAVLPNGDPIWYIYTCRAIYDEVRQNHRVVGKMSEVFGHKLEMDILKTKSEAGPAESVYNESATKRYIRNYLRVVDSDINNGMFFIIELENFDKISDTFGQEVAKDCLKDVGDVMRSTFRSSDIIGRRGGSEFYVFINSHRTNEFAQKKKAELCEKLSKIVEKDGTTLSISANAGIAFYPEDGSDFETLYVKAKDEMNHPENSD